jgi:hypothetical protein
MRLYDFDVRWRVRQGVAEVLDLAPVGDATEQG